jgi:hypothetical protein
MMSSVGCHNSSLWVCRHDVEWLVDLETKVFVGSSGLDLISFILIDNLPFLGGLTITFLNNDCSSFFVSASFDGKSSSVLGVLETSIDVFEELVPSGVGVP